MSYIDPATVTSPKTLVSNVQVLCNAGEWSVAELFWDKQPRLGVRWNGSENEPGIGSPQSRGLPTWFIVPPELADPLRIRAAEIATGADSQLAEGYRAMAADEQRERAAYEWSEGLIGDGFDGQNRDGRHDAW